MEPNRYVYLVHMLDAEPYSDYGDCVGMAFTTKEAAEKFLSENTGVFEKGYTYWDDDLQEEVVCDRDHGDAVYSHGWRYSSYISCVKLEGDI